jgi:hypothetical protein
MEIYTGNEMLPEKWTAEMTIGLEQLKEQLKKMHD